MILIRKTLLLPRSCSMNNMTPGPSPMTSVFLNLRAKLISAALSLTKSCSHLTGRNTLLEPPALSLDGEPPLRVAALPRTPARETLVVHSCAEASSPEWSLGDT